MAINRGISTSCQLQEVSNAADPGAPQPGGMPSEGSVCCQSVLGKHSSQAMTAQNF